MQNRYSDLSEDDEQSAYNLSLETAGKKLICRKDSVEILCMSPCLIREDHRIFFVSDVDGSKLKPFLSKENILIPKKAELKYFSGFVLNTINNLRLRAQVLKLLN